jgi:anti-sigma factor RsiW
MTDDPTNSSDDRVDPIDPRVAAVLQRRFTKTKRAAGVEPELLEELAQLVDGTLPIMRRARVEARLEADPELAEVVRTLREIEGLRADEPLVMPPAHAQRVGAAAVSAAEQYARIADERAKVVSIADAAKAPSRGIRPLTRPEPVKDSGRSRRFVAIGLGTALAMAAVMFLVTRPSSDKRPEAAQGAGLSAAPEAVALRFQGADVVVDVRTQTAGRVVAVLVSEAGSQRVGELEIGSGKSTLLVAVPKGTGCRFIVAMTVDEAGGARAIAGTGSALLDGTCGLVPVEALLASTGARQVGAIRLP